MKRILCACLAVLMSLTAMAFVGCGKSEPVKLGLGIVTVTPQATSATDAADGKAQATMTVAAVTLDAAGKILACQLDCADATVAYTGEGKAVANDSFKTKYEYGKDYNMVAYGKAAKEWFEQADAFETVVVGKTLDEVKALVAEGGKGNDAVVTAGCTIIVADFVKAVEKACNNAVETTATAAHTLKLGVHTQQSTKDATENAAGYNQLETTFFAATVDEAGKVTAAASDCVQVQFGFDATGASTFDTTKAVTSKREAGDKYGMVAYGNAAKEWYQQADAFNATCVGKTASEITGLMGSDNYGSADVKAAGCTILVNGFVKAAAKIG